MSIIAAILFGLSILLWLPLAANAVALHKGDPAGRGLAVAYGAVNAGALLLAMGSFCVVSVCSRGVSSWLGAGLAVLVPVVCVSSQATLVLIGRRAGMRFAAATPVLAPGLLLGLVAWCRWWRPAGAAATAAEIVLAVLVMVVCLLPWAGSGFAMGPRPRSTKADEFDLPRDATGKSA